jgi:hypothetical protein
MTQWSPDTCGCVVQYDEAVSAVTTIVARCSKHVTFPQASLLNILLTHNRRKNSVVSWLTANAVTYSLTTVTGDGGSIALLGIPVYYKLNAPAAVDPLHVVVSYYTAAQVSTLQAALDAQFGTNVCSVSIVDTGP